MWEYGTWGAAFALVGCTLGTVDKTACDSSAQCRQNFGLGSVCAEDGFCALPEPNERCNRSFPVGLLGGQSSNDRIVFGSLFDSANEAQKVRERSIQLAIKQINAEGGLEGREFGIVLCDVDDETDGVRPAESVGIEAEPEGSEGVVSSARYLAEVLGVPVIFGPASSKDVLAAFVALGKTGTLVLSPSATSTLLTELDELEPSDEKPGLLWRTPPPDNLQVEAIVRDMSRRGVGSVAVVGRTGTYGQGIYENFLEQYQGLQRQLFFRTEGQRAGAIAEGGDSEAEEVLFVASSQKDVRDFLKEVDELPSYADKTIFLTDSAATLDVLSVVPSSLIDQIRGTRPEPTKDELVLGSFDLEYDAKYNIQASSFGFAAHAYDAAWIAMLGAAWASVNELEISGRTVAQGLRRLSAGSEVKFLPAEWNAALQQFRAGNGVDVSGASGLLDYSGETEEISSPFQVWSIETEQNGRPNLKPEPFD